LNDNAPGADSPLRVPIACTLTPAQMADRGRAWVTLLRTSLVAWERVAGGLRLSVHPGAVQSLRGLVDLERDCCPWIDFSFEDHGLVMTAAGAGEDVLVQMFLPSGLSDRRD
jgi:hypothetical protein